MDCKQFLIYHINDYDKNKFLDELGKLDDKDFFEVTYTLVNGTTLNKDRCLVKGKYDLMIQVSQDIIDNYEIRCRYVNDKFKDVKFTW